MLQEDLEKRLEDIETKLEELEHLHLDNKLKITEIMSRLEKLSSERKSFKSEEIPTAVKTSVESKTIQPLATEEKNDIVLPVKPKTVAPPFKEKKAEELPPPAKPSLEKPVIEKTKTTWSPPKIFLKNEQPKEDNEIKEKIERIKEMIKKI